MAVSDNTAASSSDTNVEGGQAKNEYPGQRDSQEKKVSLRDFMGDWNDNVGDDEYDLREARVHGIRYPGSSGPIEES